MAWRLARSLDVLRDEVNAAAPGRSKVSDGTIGDAAHASRTSDHNPYIKDANGVGVVRALDVTHDPNGGMDAHQLAEHVRSLGASGDPRVRYVISNARIASPTQGWVWRRYTGTNAHTKHAHISVVEAASGYDSTAPWGASIHLPPTAGSEDDMIGYNTRGHAQGDLQTLLNRAAEDQDGWLAAAGSKPLVVDDHAGALTFAAFVEMLDRAKSEAFAYRAAVDLRARLGNDPIAKLQQTGITGPMIAVLGDLAAAR